MDSIQQIESIVVARVKSDNGPKGASKAFSKLESKMKSLKERKMYGVFNSKTGEYFACVELDKEHQDSMGFEVSQIPGGKYAKKKIENWASRTNEISSLFEFLAKGCEANGLEVDSTRPHIEFYRSFKELILMLPVK